MDFMWYLSYLLYLIYVQNKFLSPISMWLNHIYLMHNKKANFINPLLFFIRMVMIVRNYYMLYLKPKKYYLCYDIICLVLWKQTYNIESESYYDFSYMWSEKASAKVNVKFLTLILKLNIIMWLYIMLCFDMSWVILLSTFRHTCI